MCRSFRRAIASLLFTAFLLLPALVPVDGLAQSTNDDVGDSAAARACEQTGWEDLVREDGTEFSNANACERYALLGGELQRQGAGLTVAIELPEDGDCSISISAMGLDPNTSNDYELWVLVSGRFYYRVPIATDAAGYARFDDIRLGRFVFDVVIVRRGTESAETNHVHGVCE